MSSVTKKRMSKTKRSPVSSSFETVTTSRHISSAIKTLLAVQAGGRCEFDGCNDYLFEHHVTLRKGAFGQNAHIVAFKKNGPRGQSPLRPKDINNIENLMLLCHKCHKLIDDHPENYSTDILSSQKNDHEARIKYLTDMRPDRKTAVLQFKAMVRGQTVDIPYVDIAGAVAPRYPTSKRGYLIDLGKIAADGTSFVETAKQDIHHKITSFYATEEVEQSRHVSLFAIGPIPLLSYLGHKLSDKVPVDLFQRHRKNQGWAWQCESAPVTYKTTELQKGTDPSKVGVLFSLSGKINSNQLPVAIGRTYSLYEVTLDGQNPNTDFLCQRNDLDVFRAEYRKLLASVVRNHSTATEIHIFPAVPAPIAVSIGLDRLRQVQPSLIIYNHEGPKKGFIQTLRIEDEAN